MFKRSSPIYIATAVRCLIRSSPFHRLCWKFRLYFIFIRAHLFTYATAAPAISSIFPIHSLLSGFWNFFFDFFWSIVSLKNHPFNRSGILSTQFTSISLIFGTSNFSFFVLCSSFRRSRWRNLLYIFSFIFTNRFFNVFFFRLPAATPYLNQNNPKWN